MGLAVYLNFFVLVTQLFLKVPALRAIAPNVPDNPGSATASPAMRPGSARRFIPGFFSAALVAGILPRHACHKYKLIYASEKFVL
jgi:hypothetical protein